MHSTAQAWGRAASVFPPHASAAATVRAGRIRLPPANNEYRIARWIVVGFIDSFGRNLSSARFTAAVRVSRYFTRSIDPVRLAPARVAVSDICGVFNGREVQCPMSITQPGNLQIPPVWLV